MDIDAIPQLDGVLNTTLKRRCPLIPRRLSTAPYNQGAKQMDLELTEEQRMLADSARAFVSEELLPHENEVEKQGEVPPDLGQQITRKAIEMGFYAANLPESVGGGGLDYTSLAVIEREFGKVSHALYGFAWRPTELLMACEGNQIERYLGPCVRAEKTECFAITEPGAGSDI